MPAHRSKPPGYARIKRGPMAADVIGCHFTQVYNAAIRDTRLSRRARGLLVELLSHQDGYGISVATLTKRGPEGRDAIRTALAELEQHGYLHRDQPHAHDGRFTEAVYQITDMPDGVHMTAEPPGDDYPWEPATPPRSNSRSQPMPENPTTGTATENRRSQPLTEKPTTAHPSPANPPPKKNKIKNTNRQKTNRPSVRDARASAADRTEGRTDGSDQRADEQPTATDPPDAPSHTLAAPMAPGWPAPPTGAPHGPTQARDGAAEDRPRGRAPATDPGSAVERSPGRELLDAIALDQPRYRLTGRTLEDQARVVTGMLAAGWPRAQLREVICGRPLPPPEEIRTTVGGVVAARLRAAAALGPPRLGAAPGPGGGGAARRLGDVDGPGGAAPWDEPAGGAATPVAPAYGMHDLRVAVECEGRDGACGRPVRPGYDRCTECLDLPWCACGGARVDPERGEGACRECREAAEALGAVVGGTALRKLQPARASPGATSLSRKRACTTPSLTPSTCTSAGSGSPTVSPGRRRRNDLQARDEDHGLEGG